MEWRGGSTVAQLKGIWTSLDRGLRRVAIVMWTASALLAIGCLYVESSGWWSTRPFATNLVSALVGAMFGVPFAVIFVQYFASRSATWAAYVQRRSAVTTATRALEADFEYVRPTESETDAIAAIRKAFHPGAVSGDYVVRLAVQLAGGLRSHIEAIASVEERIRNRYQQLATSMAYFRVVAMSASPSVHVTPEAAHFFQTRVSALANADNALLRMRSGINEDSTVPIDALVKLVDSDDFANHVKRGDRPCTELLDALAPRAQHYADFVDLVEHLATALDATYKLDDADQL